MLSEEEKARLVERITFERDVRAALENEGEPSSKWFESKIGLLLIGSFITGLFVPAFQYTQETIKWKRQNSYDTAKFRLSMMRDCLREFVSLSAYPGEQYERMQAAVRKSQWTAKDQEAYRAQFVEFQNRRFQQNAKVSSLLIFFVNPQQISRTFNTYIGDAGGFVEMLNGVVEQKFANKETKVDQGRIDSSLDKMDRLYQSLVDRLKEQIAASEVENEKWM